jgi:MoxR-like ATPase
MPLTATSSAPITNSAGLPILSPAFSSSQPSSPSPFAPDTEEHIQSEEHDPRLAAHHLRELLMQAMMRVNEVIRGKPSVVHLLFVAALARGHVLIDDTPGLGKTTLARSVAHILGLSDRRIQFTPDLMPADIIGLSLPSADFLSGHAHSSDQQDDFSSDGSGTPVRIRSGPTMIFQPGPIFAQTILADEINRASPRTQSALLEAMAERQVSVDGVTYPLPDPFLVVATQNPIDSSGTFILPDSQMDRFLFRLEMGYPDEDHELALLMGEGGSLKSLRPVLSSEQVRSAQSAVDKIGVSSEVARYVHRLLTASRTPPAQNNTRPGAQAHASLGITTGLSPRAGLAILAAARAHAFLADRQQVWPEDVQSVFVAAAAHRLVMKQSNVGSSARVAAAVRLLNDVAVA